MKLWENMPYSMFGLQAGIASLGLKPQGGKESRVSTPMLHPHPRAVRHRTLPLYTRQELGNQTLALQQIFLARE